jgi:hypothetical protein
MEILLNVVTWKKNLTFKSRLLICDISSKTYVWVKNCRLIDYLRLHVPLKNFSLICWWRAAKSGLCSALRAFEQGGIFSCHTYCDTGLVMVLMNISLQAHYKYVEWTLNQRLNLNSTLIPRWFNIVRLLGCGSYK